MINLLDSNAKRDLKAARLNVILLTYCSIVGLAVVAVVLLAIFSHMWLNNRIVTATAEKAANEAGTSSYNSTRAEAAQFSANLSKINSVLQNRSHYNAALLNIASSLPQGAYITDITISPTFATAPLKITATTSTNQAALALKEKLSQSKIYTKVTIDNVSCGGDNGSGCTVALTATINQLTIFTPGATE